MNEVPALTLRSFLDEDITPERALKIGQAVGRSYKNVCVGSDTFPNSPMIKNSLISGLLSAGAEVKDTGIAPVPATVFSAKNSDCIVIASEPDEHSMIGRIDLVNTDGSVFSKEQLRELIRKNEAERTLPDNKGVGSLKTYDLAVSSYNHTIAGKFKKRSDTQIILSCGCGSASLSAPQILSRIGADVTTVDAQIDTKYYPQSSDLQYDDLSGLTEIVSLDIGSIGLALNGRGTKLAVIDEEGNRIDPENVLALILLYLKSPTIVVPFNGSAVIDDAFYGRIGEDMHTDAESPAEKHLIRADDNLESITAAIRENDAQLGALSDGTFIFPDVSLCPDGINAAAIVAEMSGENSISDLLSSFPKYVVLKESLHLSGNPEAFGKKLSERLSGIDAEEIWEKNGRRIRLSEGWFSISADRDRGHVDITSESKDMAYTVSMMELAKDLVRSCM